VLHGFWQKKPHNIFGENCSEAILARKIYDAKQKKLI
jgi:hypothetical protein